MTQKNPFEIRAEMIKLAKEYMDQQYLINIEFYKRMFEQGVIQFDDFQKATKMYSIEELMEKAKEMYSFVSTKDQGK
jgi:hypothetical protein